MSTHAAPVVLAGQPTNYVDVIRATEDAHGITQKDAGWPTR